MSFFFFLISSLKISRCFERNLSSPSGMMHLLVWPVVILGAISSSVPALVSCRACWMTLLFSPFSLCYFHRASVSWLGEKFIWLGSSRTSLCLYKVTFDDAFKIPVKRPCKKGDLSYRAVCSRLNVNVCSSLYGLNLVYNSAYSLQGLREISWGPCGPKLLLSQTWVVSVALEVFRS